MTTTARRIAGVLTGLAAVAALLTGVGPGDATTADAAAPAATDRYIVVLRHGAARTTVRDARRLASAHGGRVLFGYSVALTGFAARLTDTGRRALEAHPQVAYVEPDARVRVTSDQVDPPSWGLDRIDQRQLPMDGVYHHDRSGAGVAAYVVDTGVRRTHRDFGGRARRGFTALRDGVGTRDCNGHGTHVAGTLGGRRFGVAKRVTIIPVRVLDCAGFGSWSGILRGIDWVTRHHTAGPAVANISISGPRSRAMNDAVRRSIADGITYAIAAGNDGWDACANSPASTAQAITVGASDERDRQARFSNRGPCVDVFAPGVGIRSATSRNDRGSRLEDGTSMAAPHVAGAAAIVLSAYPTASPAAVAQEVLGQATRRERAPHRLLYTNVLGAVPPPGNAVANPGFESGDAAWTAPAGVIRFRHHARRSGNRHALLGARDGFTQTLEQQVRLPAGTPTLSFWMKVLTDEPAGPSAYDEVVVRVVAGGELDELRTVSSGDGAAGYQHFAVDLTEYAGQTVAVQFWCRTDISRPSRFHLDDLRIAT